VADPTGVGGGWTLEGYRRRHPAHHRVAGRRPETDGGSLGVDADTATATPPGGDPSGSAPPSPRWHHRVHEEVIDWFDAAGLHERITAATTGVTLLQFDYEGERLVAAVDADGNRTRFDRDDRGRLRAVVSPDGDRTAVRTDENGRVLAVADPATGPIRFEYDEDAQGLLTGLIDDRGRRTFVYDERGLAVATVDPDGGRTDYLRTDRADGYEVRTLSPGQRELAHDFTFLAEGGYRHRSTCCGAGPEGVSTEVSADGRTRHTTFPDGTTVVLEETGTDRDPDGATETVARSTTYRSPGGVTARVGLEKSIERDRSPDGTRVVLAREDVRVETAGGRFDQRLDADRNAVVVDSPGGTVETVFDDCGRIVRRRSTGELPVRYEYDDRGRLARVLTGTVPWRGSDAERGSAPSTAGPPDPDAETATTTASYDDRGRLVRFKDALGRAVEFGYDAADRLVEERLPGGRTVGYEYGNGNGNGGEDGDQREHEDERGDEPAAEKSGPAVSGRNGPAGERLEAGGEWPEEADVPAGPGSGAVTAVVAPSGAVRTFEYGPGGRLAATTGPSVDGRRSRTHYEFDADGLLVGLTHGEIDDADRDDTDGRRDPDPPEATVGFERDVGGRTVGITTDDGRVAYSYDDAGGRVARIETADTMLSFERDGPLVTAETWTGRVAGRIERAYGDGFRVTDTTVVERPWNEDGQTGPSPADSDRSRDRRFPVTIERGSTGVTRIGRLAVRRGANGGVVGTSLGVVTDRRNEDPGETRTSYRATVDGDDDGDGDDPLFATTVIRDALGRPTRIDERIRGNTRTREYEYDESGRLASERIDGRVTTYRYDENGNRIERAGPDGVTATRYDAADRIVTHDGRSVTYDPAGRLAAVGGRDVPAGADQEDGTATGTEAETTTYRYDALGGLRRVDLADGRRVEYVLDGVGRRVGRLVDGTLTAGYLYDGGRVVAELDADGRVRARFVHLGAGPTPAYVEREGRTYRILADHLGSPRLVVDAESGVVAQELDYDAFGRITRDTAPGFQPFGFAGGLADPATGLVRFGARDYDPETGRWTAPDPLLFGGGSTNLYEYALGVPTALVDPDGRKVYVCNKPLDVLTKPGTELPGQRKTGEQLIWPVNELARLDANPLYHEYLCIQRGTETPVCNGMATSGGPFAPGTPSYDRATDSGDKYIEANCDLHSEDDACVESCLRTRLESPDRPYYSVVANHLGVGDNCQSWAQESLGDCERTCNTKTTPEGIPTYGWHW
jgi:RHS repeat-associated protein